MKISDFYNQLRRNWTKNGLAVFLLIFLFIKKGDFNEIDKKETRMKIKSQINWNLKIANL